MGDFKVTRNLHDSEDKDPEEEHRNEEAEQQELLHEQVVLVLVEEEAQGEEEEQQAEGEEEEDEEEEREEALSLSDLPLTKEDQNNVTETIETTLNRTLRSSSESSDMFEFFSPHLSSDSICSAEDVIFAGKLIPLNEQHLNCSSTQSETPSQAALQKRSESLPSSVSRSSSTKFKLVRTSYSLDNRKAPPPEQSTGIERNLLVKSDAVVNKKVGKPRWYVLMFGMVKFPAEMELNDIKSRQLRQNPPKKNPANSGSGSGTGTGSGSWKILKALSCKDHASVQATTSFYVPAA